MTVLEDFIGDWKLISSENFEELMKALDVGFVLRKIGAQTKPNIKLTVNGDEWTMTTTSPIKTHIMKYKMNEEFDETTLDGRNCRSTIVFDGEKIIHTQKDKSGNVQCLVTRQITPSGEMKAVAKAGDVESVRIYSKEK